MPPHQGAFKRLHSHLVPCFALYFLNNPPLDILPLSDIISFGTPLRAMNCL